MPKIQPKIQPAFYSRGISFALRGEESRFLCKFAVPTERGKEAMGDAAGGPPVMCGDGKANRDVKYSK